MNRQCAATLALAGGFSALFGLVSWQQPAPRLVWNASPSVPLGLYRVTPGARPARGDLVAIAAPPRTAAFLARRGYVPADTPLLKHVAALPGQRVCRIGARIMIDGALVALARPRDRTGRPLPVWLGCIDIAPDEIFLLNAPQLSLDGRYFGPFPARGLIGTAHPVLVTGTVPASLSLPSHQRNEDTRP